MWEISAGALTWGFLFFKLEKSVEITVLLAFSIFCLFLVFHLFLFLCQNNEFREINHVDVSWALGYQLEVVRFIWLPMILRFKTELINHYWYVTGVRFHSIYINTWKVNEVKPNLSRRTLASLLIIAFTVVRLLPPPTLQAFLPHQRVVVKRACCFGNQKPSYCSTPSKNS